MRQSQLRLRLLAPSPRIRGADAPAHAPAHAHTPRVRRPVRAGFCKRAPRATPAPRAALAQAVERGPPGAMRDELAQLLRDLRAGRPRDEAMRALAARAQLPAISSLVAALASTQKQGASLGPILRAQAEQRRTERFLRAEKLAMEAPVKMLMPLVLFIFPGTFAVLLFPVVSRLIAEGVL